MSLDTEHYIFRGFPKHIKVSDELYWKLKAGSRGKVSILGEAIPPIGTKESVSDTMKYPVFWTVEHSGEEGGKPGRVFSCVIGHTDELVFSSSFQVVMMRAIAWCLDEPCGQFLQIIADK